jgi:tRNA wybutosine-synthesizing protein 4
MSKFNNSSYHQDEAATINTNSYSIVSKRSVEKLYFPHEPSFLSPFVPNFKRRAPLINRGYWLRMKAIESSVHDFLRAPSHLPKAVVNLGCGYDTLPFKFRTRHKPDAAAANHDAVFIDVDYRDLLEKKLAVLTKDATFAPFLPTPDHMATSTHDPILFKSTSYCAIAIDLGHIDTLRRIFTDLFSLESLDILFIAEVSITYMPLDAANCLLEWASSFENGEYIVVSANVICFPSRLHTCLIYLYTYLLPTQVPTYLLSYTTD